VPSAKAVNETAPVIQLSPDELPDSSSYMSMTVPWKKTGLPTDLRTQAQTVQVLGMLAHFPKSVTLDTNKNEIVLRDYSGNVRRMLALVEQFNSNTAIARVSNLPTQIVVKSTVSSFDAPVGPAGEWQFDTGELNLAAADLSATLDVYQKVSGRTVIRAGDLRPIEVTLHNQAHLNRVETLRLLDTTLAQHGINMVVAGDNAVIATRDPRNTVPPIINFPPSQLPDSSSYMMTTVRLKESDPELMVRNLGMKAKCQNSVIYMPAAHLMILRDYSSSIRQMLTAIPEVGP
jgi:type II secretory pathway component GspD/PulD (secretin)